MTTSSGSTPTLALGVSAAGAGQVAALVEQVRFLKTELTQLKELSGGNFGGSSSNLGGLDQLTAQMTRMRREMTVAVAGIRTDLAGAFKTAAKSVEDGAAEVEEAQKKAIARLRVSGQTLNAEGGLKYNLSGNGLAAADSIKELQQTLAKRPEVIAAAMAKEEAEYIKSELQQKALWEKFKADKVTALAEEARAYEAQADRMKALRLKALAEQKVADDAALAETEAYNRRVMVADASFNAATPRAQLRRTVNARAQLDQPGIDSKEVTASYGTLATAAAQAAPSLEKLKEQMAALSITTRGSHSTIMEFANGITVNSRVMKEAGTVIEEIAGGATGRLRQSFFALLNQMGVMKGLLGGLLSPLGLTAVAVGAVALAAFEGEKEVRAFNNAMQMTGGMAGVTRGQFDELAQTLATKTFSSIGTAKEALMDLVKTGRFTSDGLAVLGQAAISQSKITGESLASIAKDYEKMPDGVYKWAEAHNKSMHFMTEEELAHIHTLEQHGKGIEALIEVGKKLNDHMGKEAENLGYLEKLWRGLGNAVSATKDALLSIGRDKTTDDKLKALQGELAIAEAAKNNPIVARGQGHIRDINEIQKEITFYARLKESQEDWAKGTSDAALANEKASSATDRLTTVVEKYNRVAKERKALEDLHRDITEHNAVANSKPFDPIDNRNGLVTPAIQAQMEAEIHQRINGTRSVNDGTFQLMRAAYQAENSLATTAYKQQKDDLDDHYHNQLISEGEYYAMSLRNERTYEDKLLADLEAARLARHAEAEKEKAALGGKNLPTDQVTRLRDTIDNRVTAEDGTAAANVEKIITAARTANQKELDKYAGSVIKADETNAKYWGNVEKGIKRESDLEAARHKLAGATDVERARAEAKIKVDDSALEKMREMTEAADTAAKAASDMRENMDWGDPLALGGLSDLEQAAGRAADRLVAAQQELKKLEDMASNSAEQKLQNQQDEEMRKNAKKMGDTVRDKLADAILSGGKTGFQGMMDWVKNTLLKEPLKVILQGMLQPVGNMVSNMASSAMGLGTSGGMAGNIGGIGNLGSSAFSAYNLTNNIGTGSGFLAAGGTVDTVAGTMGYGSGIAGAATTTSEIAGTAASTSESLLAAGSSAEEAAAASEALGATMAETAATTSAFGAGMTAAVAAIPVIGWIAAAAMIAYAVFGGKGGGPKTESAYNYNQATTNFDSMIPLDPRTAAADPSKAKQLSSAISSGYRALADSLGIVNDTLKVGILVSQDPQGTAKTILGVTTSSGYDRNARMGGIENVGRSDAELSAAVAEETTRAIFDALSKNIGEGKIADYIHQFNSFTSSLTDLQQALTVAQDVGTLDHALDGFGGIFLRIKDLSVTATVGLNELAGGVSNLIAKLSSYYKNFYTLSEQRDAITQNISKALNTAGINLTPTQVGQLTRDQFRSIVESVDVTTKAGESLLVTLLGLGDTLATITPMADDGSKALQTTITDLGNTISKFKDFGKTLRDFRDSLLTGNLSPLTPAQKYVEAANQFHATYTAAMSGDADALSNLQNVSQAFLQASQGYNASNSQYTHDFGEVQTALTLAATSSDSLVTLSQSQLTVAQNQLTALTSLVNVTTGLDQSVLDLIKNQVSTTTAPGPTSDITYLYQSLLNRNPEAGGLTYWTGMLNSGHTLSEIEALIKATPEYQSLHPNTGPATTTPSTANADPNNAGNGWTYQTGLTNDTPGGYATGGYAPAGLAMVGEQGPELVDFKTPARVYTATQTTGLLGGAHEAMATRMDALIAEVKQLRDQHGNGVRAQIAAAYDSNSQAADKIVEGSSATTSRAAWSERQKVNIE